jgi:hypothetical protein
MKGNPMRLLAFLFAVAGCMPVNRGQLKEAAGDAPADSRLYGADRVVEIQIQTTNWDVLRQQEPRGGRCVFGFVGSQYDWFKFEEIKIDGVTMKDVGVKKKSWCNSESKTKPSLNIKLDKYVKAQGAEAVRLWGTDALILNNSLQDKAYVRQCLSYQIFARAGIVAPLCGFAHVIVNGQDLGVFVNLQPMKESFIREKFGEPLGNLYEVAGETFEDWALERFAAGREGWRDAGLADIKAVNAAIKSDKSPELRQLAEIVDMQQFLSYWALEVILTHWDGLTLGTNNTYLYFDSKGKLNALPWGTDQILNRSGARETLQIYAGNNLAAKIYDSVVYQDKLAGIIKDYMQTLWSEAEVTAAIDRMADLITPYIPSDSMQDFKSHLEILKTNARNRRAQIASFIDKRPEPRASVAPPAERYFPKCSPAGFEYQGVHFVSTATEGNWGYMQREAGPPEGVPCKVDLTIDDHRLPSCAEACSKETQTAKDWGSCPRATGFSCLKN